MHSAEIGFEPGEGFEIAKGVEIFSEWTKSDPGAAVISDAKAQGGAGSLEILPSAGNLAARKSFPVPGDGIVFVDFAILPPADASKAPVSTVDANGARLGFIRQGEAGAVVAVSPAVDARSGTNVVATGYSFPVDEGGNPSAWIRVTVRQDLNAKTWDLYLDGRLALVDQPVPEGASKGSAEAAFYASPVGTAFVDDLSIAGANPLFADADKDGIPDAMEKILGSNPFLGDRDALGRGRQSAIGRFAAIGDAPAPPSGRIGAKAVLYIDNKNGSDQNSGEFSYRLSDRGPKATLQSLAGKGAANTVVVLLPSPEPYVCPDFPAGRAPDLQINEPGTVTLSSQQP